MCWGTAQSEAAKPRLGGQSRWPGVRGTEPRNPARASAWISPERGTRKAGASPALGSALSSQHLHPIPTEGVRKSNRGRRYHKMSVLHGSGQSGVVGCRQVDVQTGKADNRQSDSSLSGTTLTQTRFPGTSKTGARSAG